MEHKTNESDLANNEKIKIVFKDLEPLLQQCLNDQKLEVIDYTTTKLLPAGENYGSIMMKIDATIRKSKFTKEESLHLVAKTPSRPDKPIITWPIIFKKELFMYTELFPLYREIEREAGIADSDSINLLPKYVGHRYSLKGNDVVDENSALLMENLHVNGFYNVNRLVGLDVQHARLALISLARYHALGIVMKQKRPSFAEKAIRQASVIGVDFTQLDEGLDNVCETFVKAPCLQKHLATIESSFKRAKGGETWRASPKEPWATIIHGDFWTNNILFHKDDNGKVDDVKFVDFQVYLYHSPLKDLPNFLSCCLDVPTQDNHLEELLELYYRTFVETLRRMSCNTVPFTRKSFDDELKQQAINEFPFCAMWTKFKLPESFDEKKSNEELVNNILVAETSDTFIDKLMSLLEVYEKMKWF